MNWPEEIRQKARELAVKGLSRSQISVQMGVPAATLSKWVVYLDRQPITYPEEVRKKAIDLSEKGMSRIYISKKLGINIKTISGWVNPSLWFAPYPLELKRKARMMVKRGIEKGEVAERLKVHYGSVSRWTRDLTNRHSHVNGRYFLVLAELVREGFFISNRNDYLVLKFLKKYVPIKSKLVGRLVICYLPGRGASAFKGLINRKEIQPLTERKVNLLKEAFNIRQEGIRKWKQK
jgi:hypothetical protein